MKTEEIRPLAEMMREFGLTRLEVTEGNLKVLLESRPAPVAALISQPGLPQIPASAAQEAAPQPAQTASYREIKSPMVGVFYAAPTPESDPYVSVGGKIKKGDILCVIEAMKLMNELNSDQDGEIAEICAENGQIVEYGQTLFKLK